MVKSIILFDLRVPDIGPPAATVYAEAQKMARFADEAGFDYISISEHHGSEDSYLPAPFVVGGACAALTKRIRILLNAVVLPLHDPAKIAEQIAVLDLLSGGRLEIVFGAGYVPGEFARFGIPMNQRGRLLDEGLEIIVRALAGERFEANGREVFVRPLPHQRPHPPFILGGGVEASARRAAKFGFGFAPMKPGLLGLYEEECRKLGQPVGTRWGLQGPIMVHVAEHPETAWKQLEPHLSHVAGTYARWAAEGGDTTSTYDGLVNFAAIRDSGKYAVVTPEDCVRLAEEQEKLHSSIVFQPLIGGLSPEEGWRSLRLYADKVLPVLRARGLAPDV